MNRDTGAKPGTTLDANSVGRIDRPAKNPIRGIARKDVHQAREKQPTSNSNGTWNPREQLLLFLVSAPSSRGRRL